MRSPISPSGQKGVIPPDPRLKRLAARLQEPDGLRCTLEVCARSLRMSPRTLGRLVHTKTGLSFGRWKRQLHLEMATARLIRGESVNEVACAVGYESPSAFIAMFRRALGTTPARFAERARGSDLTDQKGPL